MNCQEEDYSKGIVNKETSVCADHELPALSLPFPTVWVSRYSSFLNWVTFHLKAEYLMRGRPLRVWFGMVPSPSLLTSYPVNPNKRGMPAATK